MKIKIPSQKNLRLAIDRLHRDAQIFTEIPVGKSYVKPEVLTEVANYLEELSIKKYGEEKCKEEK
jgi:hypothetical protein